MIDGGLENESCVNSKASCYCYYYRKTRSESLYWLWVEPRLDIYSERERPGDCSAWTLPVGIRKSDGPVWSSSVRRDGQYVQCKRESFQGGSPRGGGDGVKQVWAAERKRKA